MADNDSLAALLVVLYAVLFWWAFRALPREGWQFLASVPRVKLSDGRWTGTNLTYYGAFTASAVVLAVALAIVLLASVAVPLENSVVLAVLVLGLCVPAAKILARLIEGKANTFTIGGASMLGLFLAPWIVATMNAMLGMAGKAELPLTVALAALSIAYAFGEGTGRLACLSFGCCYGVPLQGCHPWLSTLFGHHSVAFVGRTKKAAYESGLEAVPLVPIQAMTAAVSVGSGVIGLWLFAHGHMVAAFVTTVVITQLWRVGSECLRADYRGGGTLSWYQILALAGTLYAVTLAFWLNELPIGHPDLMRGIHSLWQPGVLLSLHALWIGMFLFTGRSRVTMSTLSLFVVKDRI
ncbi:MAG: prolipoprotein diacylglyceryl transferase [Nitrospira sp.]|nr:prolipoprotein diacylglyceryl transferase [Nitrospira sp.]